MLRSSSSSRDRMLPGLDEIPDPLKVVIHKIRHEHYEELYEPEADGTVFLEDALNEVLEIFQDSGNTLSHLRYVWMTLILALVVEPTVKYYQPQADFTNEVITLMERWIFSKIEKRTLYQNSIVEFKALENLEALISKAINFPEKMASLQSVYEAIDVFQNAIRVLDYPQAKEALLEILDECLEGYAIFPGSYGRRDLFDWWLLEVVPASWYLLPPQSLYVVESMQNAEEIKLTQFQKIEQLSIELWFFLQKSASVVNNKIEIEIGFSEIQSKIPYNSIIKCE